MALNSNDHSAPPFSLEEQRRRASRVFEPVMPHHSPFVGVRDSALLELLRGTKVEAGLYFMGELVSEPDPAHVQVES